MLSRIGKLLLRLVAYRLQIKLRTTNHLHGCSLFVLTVVFFSVFSITSVFFSVSALDAASEYLVRDALEKLYVGRTTIIIAHRLSTVQGAHSIVVLGDDGTVKERGSYKKLMNNENGYFRKLVEQQTLIE